jgi:hypothetical protein
MTRDEAIRRAAALFRLANGGTTDGETCAAVEKAQAIMTRYQIDRTALEMDGTEQEDEGPWIDTAHGGEGAYTEGRRMAQWKWRLLFAICKANACLPHRTYKSNGAQMEFHVIGKPGTCDTVRYLWRLIASQVDTIALKQSRGMGRVYTREFREGCVERIRERIKTGAQSAIDDMRNAASLNPDPHALVRVNGALERIEAKRKESYAVAASQFGVRYSYGRPRSSASHDGAAREAGRAAGDKVSLGGRARASIGG